MKYLLKIVKENNCTEAWLGIEVDNVSANKFYSSLNPNTIEIL